MKFLKLPLRTFACFLVFSFFILPTTTSATIDATINLSPKNPAPYSQLKLTLASYSFNVNTATITWKSNGSVILKGTGAKEVTIKTGGTGETSVIQVFAETARGDRLEQEIVISPASVTLLYEASESYVPLFYEGRSLPSQGASVFVTAIPSMSEDGVPLPANTLSYSWYVNDSIIKSVSGFNKQKARLSLEILREATEIKVVVRSPNDQAVEKTIKIYPHSVMPLLYTRDEILGTTYTKAITRKHEAVKDFILALEPFYVSNVGEASNSSIFTWSLDGLPVTPLGGMILAMQPKADSFGTRSLSIDVSNTKKRLQKGNISVDLVFDTR